MSENIGYDKNYWPNTQDIRRMLAATQVKPGSDYDPYSQPVYLDSSVSGQKKLYYFAAMEEYSSEMYAHTFGIALYNPPPGTDWENQTYTFYYNDTNNPFISVFINENDIRNISIPNNVNYDEDTRAVSWGDLDSSVDTVFVRVVPLRTDGRPDALRMAWESGHLNPNIESYTLPDWGPPGDYALRFESRQYRQSDDLIINRSVWYSKIYNKVHWSDPVTVKAKCGHIKALSVAEDPNQVWHAVYRDTSGELEQIKYISSKTCSAPLTLVTASDISQSLRYPSIAIDGTGIIHVLCDLQTGLEDRLMYIRYDSNGWSTPWQVASSTTSIKEMSLAADAYGGWHAVYRTYLGTYETINYISSSDPTNPVTLATTSDTSQSLRYPSIAINGKGIIHVLYDLQTTSEDHLMYIKHDKNSWSNPSEISIPSSHIKAISLAADAFGAWHAVYRTSNGDSEQIKYINNTSYDQPIVLDQSMGLLRYPSIAANQKGPLEVLYVSSTTEGTQQHIIYTHTVTTSKETCPFFKRSWPEIAWLRGIWGTSSTDIYTVGSVQPAWGKNKGSIILHYDGEKWNRMKNPTYHSLNDVWGFSQDDIFAVGAGGTILHFNGNDWQAMDSANAYDLYVVWGTSSTDVFAAGKNGTILHYNGTNWSQISIPPSYQADFYAIWGTSSSSVYVGGDGKLLHYNGSTWEEIINPLSHAIVGIWGTSSNNLYILDRNSGIYGYDGSSWTVLMEGTPFSNYGGGIEGTSSSNIFAVGSQKEMYRFNGSTWEASPNPSLSWLTGVWVASPNDVYATGYRGTIFHFNGTSWETMPDLYFTPDADEEGSVDGLDLAYFAKAFGEGKVASEELSEFSTVFGTVSQ